MLISHTGNTSSTFQWDSALSSEKAESEIARFLELIAIMEMPLHIESVESQTLQLYSLHCNIFSKHYGIKPVTVLVYNPTGQTIMERSNTTLKEMIIEQKEYKLSQHQIEQSFIDFEGFGFFKYQ